MCPSVCVCVSVCVSVCVCVCVCVGCVLVFGDGRLNSDWREATSAPAFRHVDYGASASASASTQSLVLSTLGPQGHDWKCLPTRTGRPQSSYTVVFAGLVLLPSYFHWWNQIQSSFRAVSEQFQSTIRALSEHYQSNFRAISEQFQSTFRAIDTVDAIDLRWFVNGCLTSGFGLFDCSRCSRCSWAAPRERPVLRPYASWWVRLLPKDLSDHRVQVKSRLASPPVHQCRCVCVCANGELRFWFYAF